MYRSLDSARIVETSRNLRRRIEERFPGSGLGRVAEELLAVTGEAAEISRWLSRPHLPLRLVAFLGIAFIVTLVLAALSAVRVQVAYSSVSDLLQGLEAGINEVIFMAVAVFFLLTLEVRLKRRRALAEIHVLRSIAHIIDMHQLTKDPEAVTGLGPRTESSPARCLTPFELTRYLDYCSEMLAVISKVAALYVQKFDDPVILTAVNDVEVLTTALSRKIWQKMIILDRIEEPGRAANRLMGETSGECDAPGSTG